MKMKINYKEKRFLQIEESQKDSVEFCVESTKLELASSILATKKSLEEAKMKLSELKTEYPLDLEEIMAASLEIRDLKDGLKELTNLQKEFGF